MNLRINRLGLFGVAVCFVVACSTTSQIAMQPAAVLERDVFTCKSLSPENRWIGVTDQFDPDVDARVVVVARFSDEDMEKTVIYELQNPLGNIVLTEKIIKPKQKTLGVYFEMRQFERFGGEGRWTATVWGDGDPIGQEKFWIGEKIEDDDNGADRYFVVGEESLLSATATQALDRFDNQSFSEYIEEATPDFNAIPTDSPMLIVPAQSTESTETSNS
ncbi:MAG: hypothetical protein P9L94_05045 [Candidatus Hinthialibacter antarcticus]|nr:hypothetical protein [Candidatus Hinthialibacter antarcticus]